MLQCITKAACKCLQAAYWSTVMLQSIKQDLLQLDAAAHIDADFGFARHVIGHRATIGHFHFRRCCQSIHAWLTLVNVHIAHIHFHNFVIARAQHFRNVLRLLLEIEYGLLGELQFVLTARGGG